MSRIGQSPINLEDNVEVLYDNSILKLKGPKGSLEMKIQNTFGWCMEKIETINIDRERRKRVE